MTQPESAEQYAQRQAAEYGQFVANQDIFYDGARAFAAGHPVPASNVAAHGYLEQGLVRAVGDPAPEPPAQLEPQRGEDIVINPEPNQPPVASLGDSNKKKD